MSRVSMAGPMGRKLLLIKNSITAHLKFAKEHSNASKKINKITPHLRAKSVPISQRYNHCVLTQNKTEHNLQCQPCATEQDIRHTLGFIIPLVDYSFQ